LSLSRSDFRIAPGLQWIGLVWIAGYTLVDPLFAIGHRILRGRAPWGGGVDHPSHGLIARLGHPWRALDMITIVHAISVGIGAGVLLRLLAPAFIALPLAGWTLLIARATAGFRARRHGERP
jgi:hypothetical protein